MNFLLSIFVCAPVFVTCFSLCPPIVCDTYMCKLIEHCDGRIAPKGGYCGCCDSCVKQLEEGDLCPSLPLLGAPIQSECGEGLYCDKETSLCTKFGGACKEEYDSKKQITDPMLGMDLPECEDDGSYKPKQCSESVCYCVSADGKQIGGATYRWEADDVKCECARERYEVTMGPQRLGQFVPQCDESGDYKSIQCHGSVCYCVDRSYGNKIEGSERHISELGNFEC
ncbi:equistatin-like [Anneissia japonica]|uniref:equistatin-like n=1 Tax=Anneissia japonica TaxID=1529436 RepID=UPI0014258041|nr:equistatin-like [Anneissia japonica]